ncbi:hypothetical protein B0H19DRAFT_1140056, partial [Mycena capillaripes]
MTSPPALAIPYEPTSQIFSNCLSRDRRVRPSPQTAPLLLAQICRQWRTIALSIPQLWNSISLDFDRHFQYDGISALLGLDTYPVANPIVAPVDSWLIRAAGCPLSITVRCIERNVLLPPGLLEIILAKSTQWGRLELRISTYDFERFNALVLGPFPVLQSLAIEVMDYSPGLPWNTGLYLRAPKLQSLRIAPSINGTLPPLSDSGSIPLSALEFRPTAWSFTEDCFGPLAQFPRLRHLIIHTPPSFFYSAISPLTIPIPPIRTLILADDIDFLKYIRVPTL